MAGASWAQVRRDRIDISGVVTIRHNSRLHLIGLGRRLIGTRVLVLIDGLEIRVISEDGELIRALILDSLVTTSRTVGAETWNDVPTHLGTMSRDTPRCPRQDSNLRFRLRRPALYPLSYGGEPTQSSNGLIAAPAAARLPGRSRGLVMLGAWPTACWSSTTIP
jgi:hypothetical protein